MKEDIITTSICKQCRKEYVPTRKGVQKFCSDSCRSRYWFLKKNKPNKAKELLEQAFGEKDQLSNEIQEKQPTAIEKVSSAGIGNSFWGSLAASAVTGIAKQAFQSDSDKPATKGDLFELYEALNQRYLPIINFKDPFNRKAFYDKGTCEIVVLNEQLNRMELPN